jgi:UDP-N-acetylglucosamine 1-carboxyvinyltransferase
MTLSRDFVVTTDCDALAVGTRLRLLRRAAGLTQQMLAERLGTTQSAIARLEAGHKRLSLVNLRRAALALGCDVRLTIVEREAN